MRKGSNNGNGLVILTTVKHGKLEEEGGWNLMREECMLLKFDMFEEKIHARKHLKENIRSVIHSVN